MTNPVPGYPVSTPYGISGQYWTTCGFHTGCDIAAPNGTPIVAPIAGQIRHRSYGSSFGPSQFAISPDPGQPFAGGEVFFAHVTDRLADGVYVAIGDPISHVGALGNATGPHLHLEYHTAIGWACGIMANPDVILAHQSGGAPANGGTVYLSKLRYGQEDSDSVRHLQTVLNGHPLQGGQDLPITGNYLTETDEEVRLCQSQHGYGNDPAGASYVGPTQAEHLFGGKGYSVINDL